MPTLKSLIGAFAAACSLAAMIAPAAAADKRPNILFMLTDDQRWDAIGYDTAYIGKWHMGEDNDANDKMPLDEGIKSELPDQKIR